MPAIKSSADLRNNYNEISTFCHNYPEPVFITKNGKGDLAVMSIEAYEELTRLSALQPDQGRNGRYCHRQHLEPFSEAMADMGQTTAVDELSDSHHFHRRTRYYACCGLYRIYPQKS